MLHKMTELHCNLLICLISHNLPPNFYPVAIGVWRVGMPCWAVVETVRGAEPSAERSAADRRSPAYAIGVIQPSRECGRQVL